MADYISKVKISNTNYLIKASELTDDLYSKLKQSVMIYKGPITKKELDALTTQVNGDVYTITDEENREVVWYKADGATTGSWVDLGYDDAHAHSVTINDTEKEFNNQGKVDFNLTATGTGSKTNVFTSIKSPGAINDSSHKHTITIDSTPKTTDTNISVKGNITTGANYTPSGTVTSTINTTYTITGASYTPQGSVTMPQQAITPSNRASGDTSTIGYTPEGTISGGSVTIPVNTYVAAVSLTSNAIKSVTATFGTGWNNFVTGIEQEMNPTSITIPESTYVEEALFNSTAKDITFTGTAGTATATYTPAGSVATSSKTIAHVDGETLIFDNSSIKEATGTFTGTKATISSSYTPSGKATIPANTYISQIITNSEETFTGSYALTRITPKKFDISTADTDTLFTLDTEKATNTITTSKNASPLLLSLASPTFKGTEKILYYTGGSGTLNGTKATITPTLNPTHNEMPLAFKGNGVILSYDKTTSIENTASIGFATTGITYTDMTFNSVDITDIDTITISAK